MFGALIWLLVVLVRAKQGRFSREGHVGLQTCCMYWTFVVALWSSRAAEKDYAFVALIASPNVLLTPFRSSISRGLASEIFLRACKRFFGNLTVINRYVSFWLGQIMKPKWIVLEQRFDGADCESAYHSSLLRLRDRRRRSDSGCLQLERLVSHGHTLRGRGFNRRRLVFGVSPCGGKARTDRNDGAASSFGLE